MTEAEERPAGAGLRLLRILLILVVLGLVLPRLLGAVTDYIFPSAGQTALAGVEPVTSQVIVAERTVYHGWLAGVVIWWQSLQRGRE